MTIQTKVALAVLAGLLAAAFVCGHTLRSLSADRDLAECQRAHAEAMATLVRDAARQEREYREREAAWDGQKKEIVREAQAKLDTHRADADRLRGALERLRRSAAATASGGAAPDPGPAAGGQATSPATDLPADLPSRLGDAAGAIAEFADRAAAAGVACERLYRAMETPRLGR